MFERLADNTVSRSAFWGALFAFSLLVVFLAAAVGHDFPVPDYDSVEYLAYARSLHIAGVYAATESGPAADAAPGREPLYSLFIAGLAKLHPAWSAALRDCSPPAQACASALHYLKYANVVMLALAAAFAGAIAQLLGGSRLAAIVAAGYVSFNFTMWRDIKYVISDWLAVLLTALAVLALVIALRRKADPRGWIVVGVALALLALTKQVFLPFAILLAIGLLVYGVLERNIGWRSLVPGITVLTVVAVINGGWLLRNVAHFGMMSDGRGSVALSTREVFDHLTPAEHAVAFLWFMRPPGRNIARRYLPEETWRRFVWLEPDGFLLLGQVVNPAARVARLRETGVSNAVAQNRSTAVVVGEILAHWPGYLASMPALFYRGLWFDAFMPLSFPLFVLPFLWAWRERWWLLPVALSPALWSLFIYPAISLNIQRYQFTVVIALAVTAGLVADRLARGRAAQSK